MKRLKSIDFKHFVVALQERRLVAGLFSGLNDNLGFHPAYLSFFPDGT